MLKNLALGAYSFAEFAACTAVFMPIMAVSWHRHQGDPTQRMPGRWMRRFGRATTNLSPVWRFRVEGDPPADIDRRGYVVIANHESTADPFLLSHLPWDMRWVAKQEIFDLPIWGRLMKYGGDIPLRRGQKDSVIEMMAECRRTLEAGMSVMMFPEGTRSKDGALLPFKDGAFELALAAGAPILPVVLTGTRDCMPKGSKWLGHARAVARALPPISTEGLGPSDRAALKARARSIIADGVDRLRADLGMPPAPPPVEVPSHTSALEPAAEAPAARPDRLS